MIFEQITLIIKMVILGIFIAIMFDNISEYCNIIFSIIIWIGLIYIISLLVIEICDKYEFSFIIYYVLCWGIGYFLYYRFMKKKFNKTMNVIINSIKKIFKLIISNKKIISTIKYLFLFNYYIRINYFLKNKLFKKIKKNKENI